MQGGAIKAFHVTLRFTARVMQQDGLRPAKDTGSPSGIGKLSDPECVYVFTDRADADRYAAIWTKRHRSQRLAIVTLEVPPDVQFEPDLELPSFSAVKIRGSLPPESVVGIELVKPKLNHLDPQAVR